nr:hypothetical protein EDGQKNGF_EDGQKNGF_CDS_0002 [Microvirus sp.]
MKICHFKQQKSIQKGEVKRKIVSPSPIYIKKAYGAR